MLKNYLVVAFRNLLKNKVFTLINIIGLGIALAVCIVAFFNHMFNYEFDRANKNFETIYRVTSFRDMQGREQEYGLIPSTLGVEIKKDLPGIEKAARLQRTVSPVKVGTNVFASQISFVDPEFLDIFTFSRVKGDLKSISEQGNVIVSQEMALRLYGTSDPVGKNVSVFNDKGKEFVYTISGVFTDLPENCSFRIDVLSQYDNFLSMWEVKDTDWKLWTTVLFIMAPDKSTLGGISRSLGNYLPVQNRAREDFKITRFNLIQLKDVGSATRTIWSSGLFPSLHPAALIAPTVMAAFILLIACFNFANTSRSIFSKRLREIGLRKTFGGVRSQLITQFMIETLIICLLSLFVALVIAEFLVPAYSNLWNYMSIELTFSRYGFFWIFLIILVLLTGFISGVYPAIYVSSFNPVNIIKGSGEVKGTGSLSIILLSLQFSISVASLVLGVSFWRNAQYQRTLDLGYDRDKVIVVPVPQVIFTSLKNEIAADPRVISAAGTQNHIGWGSYRRPVKDMEKRYEVDVLDIGPEYAGTMGLHLIEGRLFDKTRSDADRSNNSIVVNRKFVKDLGWDSGPGKYVTLYDTMRLNVIGVVEDFYTSGLWQKIEPTMLRLTKTDQSGILVIRSNPENLAGVLEYASTKWKQLAPDAVFEGRLQEDTLQEEKNINGSILKVNVFLAITATILSLIGMYNMVSIDIIKRTKEIGIRKIQGAPVYILMYLIGRKYLFVLLAATILGCAGGYYLTTGLLDSIWDYFQRIGAGTLIISASVMFFATILTVVFRITKASLMNPVVSLRYE